jgi:hypothetical protein
LAPHALGFVAHLENQGSVTKVFATHRILEIAVLGHLELLGDLRLLVGINEFVGDLSIAIFEEVEQFPGTLVISGGEKGFDVQILLDLVCDSRRLV